MCAMRRRCRPHVARMSPACVPRMAAPHGRRVRGSRRAGRCCEVAWRSFLTGNPPCSAQASQHTLRHAALSALWWSPKLHGTYPVVEQRRVLPLISLLLRALHCRSVSRRRDARVAVARMPPTRRRVGALRSRGSRRTACDVTRHARLCPGVVAVGVWQSDGAEQARHELPPGHRHARPAVRHAGLPPNVVVT